MSKKLTPMIIIELTPVNELMTQRIRQSFCVVSLVSLYALTEAIDLTVKDAFYATLESVVDQCPRRDTLLVLGISMHRLELIGMVMIHVFVPMSLEL